MAEYRQGDRVVKMSGVCAGKYGTVNSVREDGTLNVTFDGERISRFCDPERCGKVAANATKSRLKGFKVGDKVKDRHGNVGIVEEIQTDDAGPFGPPPSKYGDLLGIKIDGGRIGWLNETNAVLANSCAANAKFKVGDRFAPKDDLGMTLVVKKIVKHPTWGVVYAVDAKGEDWYTEDEMVARNSCAANAEITPELRKAYDEWKKAKTKLDKWWNPDRRLSERPPKGADEAKKGLDFSAVFKRVTGKLPPSGYGSMSLEQMVDAVSKNAVARNGEKRLRTAEDKNGNVIRVGDMVKTDGGKKGKVESIWEYDGEGPYVIIAGSFRPVKSYLFVTKV